MGTALSLAMLLAVTTLPTAGGTESPPRPVPPAAIAAAMWPQEVTLGWPLCC